MLHIKPIISTLLRSKSGPILLLIQIILSVAIVSNACFIINQRLELMTRESGIDEEAVFDLLVYNFDKDIDLSVQNTIDIELIRSLPNVLDATSSSMTPLSGGGWMQAFVAGSTKETAKDTEGAAAYLGDEHMISTLGLTLIEGRNFYAEEVKVGRPELRNLAIVSSAFAKATWGDESAIGQVLYRGAFGEQPMNVIGVVKDLQGAWVDSPFLNNSIIFNVELTTKPYLTYLVRTNSKNMTELKESISSSLLQENRNRVVKGFTWISEHKKELYINHQAMATVLTLMVILLLLITSLGLAGMVMFNIERRTKQIGTRRALGAKKRDIIYFFLMENYIICLVGGIIGVILAFQLGQQLMKLYSLPILNPVYPTLTFIGLFLITTLAVIIPARVAANISPSIATRSI